MRNLPSSLASLASSLSARSVALMASPVGMMSSGVALAEEVGLLCVLADCGDNHSGVSTMTSSRCIPSVVTLWTCTK